ncbi:MAG: hypothetical protein O2971_15785 [Proteobacteria bacterium]|nr:hypothetical protein [Pseudomonadota bacterium]
MKKATLHLPRIALFTSATIFSFGSANLATATAPCEDFGECKVLIEINASDGDIGFHFLMDGDDLNSATIYDPNGKKIFEDKAKGALKDQKLTETFTESAEPLCWLDPEREEDDEVVTLEEFIDRWTDGPYLFIGKGDGGEKSFGETELSFGLPAAPADLDFDGAAIFWDQGDDLGNCATASELDALVLAGTLPIHPENVDVAKWEIVIEPDVDDGDPSKGLKFTIRVKGDIALPASISVPEEYLDSLPEGTPMKVEVGAIAADDNATFSEAGDFCVTEDGECEEEE